MNTPFNERPTPIADKEVADMGELFTRHAADFARTLERSLAERTEERDEWASLAAQYSAEREHNANMALAYKAELDTARAALEAIEGLAETNTARNEEDQITLNAVVEAAQEALEETK